MLQPEPTIAEESANITANATSQVTKRQLPPPLPKGAPELNWEVLYVARETYGLERLDVNNMKKMLDKLHSDHDLVNRYYLYNSAGFDNGPCDPLCTIRQLCTIPNLELKGLIKCLALDFTSFNQQLSDMMGVEYAKQNAYRLYHNAVDETDDQINGNTTTDTLQTPSGEVGVTTDTASFVNEVTSTSTPDDDDIAETSTFAEVLTTETPSNWNMIDSSIFGYENDEEGNEFGYLFIILSSFISISFCVLLLVLSFQWNKKRREAVISRNDAAFTDMVSGRNAGYSYVSLPEEEDDATEEHLLMGER